MLKILPVPNYIFGILFDRAIVKSVILWYFEGLAHKYVFLSAVIISCYSSRRSLPDVRFYMISFTTVAHLPAAWPSSHTFKNKDNRPSGCAQKCTSHVVRSLARRHKAARRERRGSLDNCTLPPVDSRCARRHTGKV